MSNMPVAAKTGTSQESNDLWISAFTPYYTASVWADTTATRQCPDRARAGTRGCGKILWNGSMRILLTKISRFRLLSYRNLYVPQQGSLQRAAVLPGQNISQRITYRRRAAQAITATGILMMMTTMTILPIIRRTQRIVRTDPITAAAVPLIQNRRHHPVRQILPVLPELIHPLLLLPGSRVNIQGRRHTHMPPAFVSIRHSKE